MESDYQTFRDAMCLLSMERLSEFDKSIAALSDVDKKQQRLQYLHDTIQPIVPGRSFLESLEAFVKGMALYLMPLAILFMFLPLFVMTRFQMMRKRSSVDRQLSVALAYWEINKEDLNES